MSPTGGRAQRHRRPTEKRRQEPPPGSSSWTSPWAQLRSANYHPFIYRRMLRQASPDARPGDVVAVYDKDGERFGTAFYNPRSKIALRMIRHDDREIDEAFFRDVLTRAVSLRRDVLELDSRTNAYRIFHSEGDGLSGLTADRFDNVLSVQVFSYGVYRQLGSIIPILHELCGTVKERIQVDPHVASLEGFRASVEGTEGLRNVRIGENGIRFAVNFESGHKTGFFCDQRDNRARIATFARGKSVLDLCCYTGGFSLAARVAGDAEDVTGVDLDEKAIDQARHNANLNQTRVSWVHADVFSYARQMAQNGRRWDIVVADPSKLIGSRDEKLFEEGRRKYQDLNRLALGLVAPGGLFLTCSCSGLVSMDAFEQWVIYAAHRQGRRLQIFQRTGASADHPVLSNCLESRYLKAIWARVF